MDYSAKLSSEGILDDHKEEKQITEAEKNECVQRQLLTLSNRPGMRIRGPTMTSSTTSTWRQNHNSKMQQ